MRRMIALLSAVAALVTIVAGAFMYFSSNDLFAHGRIGQVALTIEDAALPESIGFFCKVAFLAKSDYFTGTGVKGALSRAWFEGLGMLPVDRDDSKAALDSLDTALGVLGRGEAFGIYPEGTRSRDGRLYRGRTGVAHLALTAGCPIVPVGLTGTEKLQPVGHRMPRIVPITIQFGEPIEVVGRYDGVPLGKARIVREGEAMTVLAYGTMIHVTEAVLREKGVDAEIIDLRTLVPLDIATVEKSVQKTGKCLIVHEATRTGGFGGELSALVQERCFYHLEAPIERVTGFDTPYPHSLEWAYFPGPVRIGEAVDRLMKV